MNILYSSDDNYAQHMGVSIYSLLNCNRDFHRVRIYVVDNNISENNINNLYKIVNGFPNAQIIFLPFETYKGKLQLNMSWTISLSAYARLFVSSLLPKDVERILYLDCDTIICGALNMLWEMDIDNYLIAAVQDAVPSDTKKAVELLEDVKYFNSGVLLINLELWRKWNMEEKCLSYIERHKGNVKHHDQGVLNGLCANYVKLLPLKYNLMTIHYMFNRKQILRYFKEKSNFYSEEEIKASKKNPIIIHYTPSFTCRPWTKGCKHPLSCLYWESLKHTPWKDAKKENNTKKWYVRLIEWKCRVLKR